MKKFSTIASTVLASALVLAFAASPALARQMPGAPGQSDMTITASERQTVINSLIRDLNGNYVFPELAKKVDLALRQKHKRGDYDTITSARMLSDTLTQDLQALTKDKHLRVMYSARPLPEAVADAKPSPEAAAATLAWLKARNFGVDRIERLPFNVGYLELGGFAPAKDAAETLAAAMTVLAHTDALIIDLRKNGGGDPATVTLLASYLLDERTHMTDIYYRKGNRTEQMWSSDVVPGLRYGQKKDVYVLTSKHTFSAAEDFSFALQGLKRITVVGETTGGGAHPGDNMRLTSHFSAFVPNGRSLGPVTKANWEGVGVTPDVKVSAEDAMKTAQIAILKKMAAAEQDPGKLGRINERIAKVGSENTAGSMAR